VQRVLDTGEGARDSLVKLVGELARLDRGETEGLTAVIPCAPTTRRA